MKDKLFVLSIAAWLLAGCASEYNQVFKTEDYAYKYEYAKECFALGKYNRAASILTDVVTFMKGTTNAQESLFMLAMAQYNDRDYENASQTFRRYFASYPKGQFTEASKFYVGQSLFMNTPEPRLDQSETLAAITAFQEYLDLYPDAAMKDAAHDRLYELQDKLVKKELHNAQLYFDLGSYFGNCLEGGNNYEACIITAQNALKDYPFTNLREEFAVLIMKSKFELAQQSIEEKRLERYQDAEDECYGFINEFPDSKDRAVAEKYIEKCKAVTKG